MSGEESPAILVFAKSKYDTRNRKNTREGHRAKKLAYCPLLTLNHQNAKAGGSQCLSASNSQSAICRCLLLPRLRLPMDPAKLLMSSRIAVLKRPRTVIRALAFARHDHGAGALPSHFHVRALSSSALPKMASSVASPHFSAGSDSDTAGKTLALLLTSGGGRWMLTENGEGLERTFKFKTFAKTWVCLVLSFDLSIFLPLCISYLQNSSTEPYSIRISCSSSLSPLSPPHPRPTPLFVMHIDERLIYLPIRVSNRQDAWRHMKLRRHQVRTRKISKSGPKDLGLSRAPPCEGNQRGSPTLPMMPHHVRNPACLELSRGRLGK